jgi:hypothetical protein
MRKPNIAIPAQIKGFHVEFSAEYSPFAEKAGMQRVVEQKLVESVKTLM